MLLRRGRVRSPTTSCADFSGLSIVGDNCAEVTPVPIPNTAVKLCSADGTAGGARWESTSSPALCWKTPRTQVLGVFCVMGDRGRAPPARSGSEERSNRVQG
jgi:hypothetical protein